ncbi:hypothetical protein [Brucella gallinifaecis]|uniref:hypothetical protein n=1 Tax=Brucella gallinifaecis TaxID=215590 RepID=UPI002362FE37|nr:hypothetical protein [Brucella gallinifaecis]
MSEDVNVRVETVDLNDLLDGIQVLRKLDNTVETIKVYNDKCYIKNDVISDADRQLRASAFLISDYKVAEALGEFSTFEVLHYNDAKLLQQDVLSELPVDLRESNFDTVREKADSELYKSAHEKLIMADDVIYLEAGDPVICLRLVKGNLQVFFAFRQSEMVFIDAPVIMLGFESDGFLKRQVNSLIDLFKKNSDGSVVILSEAQSSFNAPCSFEYLYNEEVITLAQNCVSDVINFKKWSSARIAAWTQLRDVLEAYQPSDEDEESLCAVSKAAEDYAQYQEDIDIKLYAMMLNEIIQSRQPIDLSKLFDDQNNHE